MINVYTRTIKMIILQAICLLCTNIFASNTIVFSNQKSSIKAGESNIADFSIKKLNLKKQTIILSIKARLDAPSFSGLYYGMKIHINGKVLRPAQPYASRLRKRKLIMKSFSTQDKTLHHGQPAYMIKSLFREKIGGGTKKEAEKNAECKEGSWLVRRSPNYKVKRRDYQTDGKDFSYEWDISDLVKEGHNEIKIRNNYPVKKSYLEVDTKIFTQPGESPLSALKNNQKTLSPFLSSGGKVDFKFLKNGKLEWTSGRTILLSGLKLETIKNKIKSSEAFSCTKISKNTLQYKTDKLKVSRSVARKDNYTFVVSDTVSSTAQDPIIFRMNNVQKYFPPTSSIKIAGMDYPAFLCTEETWESPKWKKKILRRRFKNNPTIFLKEMFSKGGIGFILLDSDSRNHHTFDLCDPLSRQTGWQAGWYEIKPGEKMVLKWEISFISNGDYFSFINKIRKELKLNNVTIAGSFNFASIHDIAENMTDEQILRAVKKHKVKYLLTWGGYLWPNPNKHKGPYDMIFGATIMYPKYSGYMNEIKKAASRIKKLTPSVKLLPYFHLSLLGTPNTNDIQKYDNEICRNQDETIVARRWMAYKKGSRFKKNTLSISMLPLNNSAYGNEIRRVMNYYVKELGVDGFFFDELSGNFHDYKKLKDTNVNSRYIEVGPNGTIYRLRTTGVHANGFVSGILENLDKNNLSAFGNGGNIDLRFRGVNSCPAFSEARLNLYQPAFSVHLDTPIALWYRPNVQTIRMLLNEGLIPGGTSWKWDKNLTAHLYPFTPRQIGAGFVIGKEALISAKAISVPTDFSALKLKQYSYDSKGIMKKDTVFPTKGQKIKVPEGGFVILRK